MEDLENSSQNKWLSTPLPFRIAEVCEKTSKTQLISCKSNKKNRNYQKWRTIVIIYCFINPLTILRVRYIYIYPYIPNKPCNSTRKVLTLQHSITKASFCRQLSAPSHLANVDANFTIRTWFSICRCKRFFQQMNMGYLWIPYGPVMAAHLTPQNGTTPRLA